MISAISSTQATSSLLATTERAAKIAELAKQVGALQQDLTSAKDSKPAELAALRSNSISQNIVSVRSEIEKIALEAQLSKLSLGNDAQVSEIGKISDTSESAPKNAGKVDASGNSGSTEDHHSPDRVSVEDGVDARGRKISKSKDPKTPQGAVDAKVQKDAQDPKAENAKDAFDRIFHKGRHAGDHVPAVYQLKVHQVSTFQVSA